MMYDIIGDVHGQAELLEKLFQILGYQQDKFGSWHHDDRIAIFVGDFINKGPEIKRTVGIVRKMVESGYAEALIGNHEWAWIENHIFSIASTIQSYDTDLDQLNSDLNWIQELPVYIEKEGLRVVHAYWDQESIEQARIWESQGKPTSGPLYESYRYSVGLLVNGPYYSIDPGERIRQNEREKLRLRMRWWNLNIRLYAPGQKPLFFGHYCIENDPLIVQGNICCLDPCAHRSGRLAAYRWHGESELKRGNLVLTS